MEQFYGSWGCPADLGTVNSKIKRGRIVYWLLRSENDRLRKERDIRGSYGLSMIYYILSINISFKQLIFYCISVELFEMQWIAAAHCMRAMS
jgi:hypothetical protein